MEIASANAVKLIYRAAILYTIPDLFSFPRHKIKHKSSNSRTLTAFKAITVLSLACNVAFTLTLLVAKSHANLHIPVVMTTIQVSLIMFACYSTAYAVTVLRHSSEIRWVTREYRKLCK